MELALRRSARLVPAIVIPVALLFPLGGCSTLIGYGVGSAIDAHHAYQLEDPDCEELARRENTYVTIELDAGRRVRGTLGAVRCDEGIVMIDLRGSFGRMQHDTLELEVSVIRSLEGNTGTARGPLTIAGFAVDVAAFLLLAHGLSPD